MDPVYLMTIVINVLFFVTLLLASIYSLSILFNRRFHLHNNMFILNICLAIMGTCIYFIIYLTMLYFDVLLLFAPRTCFLVYYTYNIACIEIPFAFLTFSIHRCCSIVYYAKPFFKTKRWVTICIAGHWIVVYGISLPFARKYDPVSICLSSKLLQKYFFENS